MAVRPAPLERVPPHNIEAEESLLGAMLISGDAIGDVQEIVGADDFYREAHTKIFSAILDLYAHGEPVDAVTVAEALKKSGALEEVGGKAYIHTLVSVVPAAANAKYYAQIVERNAVLRSLISAASQIAALGYEVPDDLGAAIDKAETLIFEATKRRIHERFTSMRELLTESFERIEKLTQSQSYVTGVPTGFPELDKITSGLQPSDLIVVAGRPSMGKTSFALSIASHVGIELNQPVAVFSLEMASQQLAQRMLCSEARVNSQNLRLGDLKEEDWARLSSAAGRLGDAPIWIDDSANLNIMELRAKARRLMRQHELSLVIVDYLQLMQGSGRAENRQQEISEISRSLKILGRELNVPILAVSQLSRAVEQRQDKRPMLADLRESGAIEQDADLVMFIYRDEMYDRHSDEKGIAEVLIRKHRNGPTDDVKLAFLEHYARFAPLAGAITE